MLFKPVLLLLLILLLLLLLLLLLILLILLLLLWSLLLLLLLLFYFFYLFFCYWNDLFVFFYLFLISYLVYCQSKKPVEEPNDENAHSLIAGIVEKSWRNLVVAELWLIAKLSTSSGKRFLSSIQRSRKRHEVVGRALKLIIDSWKTKNYSFKTIHWSRKMKPGTSWPWNVRTCPQEIKYANT